MSRKFRAVVLAIAAVFGSVTSVAAQDNCGWSSNSGCMFLPEWDTQLSQCPQAQCAWGPPMANCTFTNECWGDMGPGLPVLIICGVCYNPGNFPLPPAPPGAADETAPGPCPGPSCGGAAGGQPINLSNGNTYIEQTDIRIPGLGNGLNLTRMWNSKWPSTQSGFSSGWFGLNWRSTYEERVFAGGDGTIKYARADGSFWSFQTNTLTFQLLSPANGGATMVSESTYWVLTFKNGEKRTFDNASGSLTSIVDRNGNTTQLSYDGVNRLVTVTDPASRHLYFAYGNADYPYQVTAVTSDVGIALSYAYDGQGRLITVVKPDNTTLSFEYNDQSLITAVKDSQGKVLESHTYDSQGRGLTSARAGGVEAITVSYPTAE